MALKEVLSATGLKFGFEPNHLLFNGVHLYLREQERVVLLGPSGHGKSTLLKILAGLMPPWEGHVQHFDHPNFYQLPMKEQANIQRQLGLLFQKNALFDFLSAKENIIFSLIESGIQPHPKIAAQIADEELAKVGLSDAVDLFPSEMSGGMQKRLGIARAQALKPRILFYDEPTAGLDPVTSRQIIDLIIDLQQKSGSTILVVTSDVNRAFQVAHRIYFLYRGELLDLGSPQEARQHRNPAVRQFIWGLPEGPLTTEFN